MYNVVYSQFEIRQIINMPNGSYLGYTPEASARFCSGRRAMNRGSSYTEQDV